MQFWNSKNLKRLNGVQLGLFKHFKLYIFVCATWRHNGQLSMRMNELVNNQMEGSVCKAAPGYAGTRYVKYNIVKNLTCLRLVLTSTYRGTRRSYQNHYLKGTLAFQRCQSAGSIFYLCHLSPWISNDFFFFFSSYFFLVYYAKTFKRN